MDNMERFRGIFPAFYAGYDSRGSVSREAVRSQARYILEKGFRGTYACGSSGECIYQSVGERRQALEAIMEEAAGKLTVIAHVACNSTRDSVELARHAEALGVDAIAAIPPIYFHLPDHAIAEYWNAISAAAPHTPFIIYNIPALAGVALSLPLLTEMLQNPLVAGVKCSSPLPQDILQFKEAGGPDFLVYNGTDEQYAAGFAMGADGGIGGTYAVMPELFLSLDDFLKKGELKRAQELQAAICRIIAVMYGGRSNLYAVMKEILRRRDGVDLGGVRAPLVNLLPEDLPRVEEAIGLIDACIGRLNK